MRAGGVDAASRALVACRLWGRGLALLLRSLAKHVFQIGAHFLRIKARRRGRRGLVLCVHGPTLSLQPLQRRSNPANVSVKQACRATEPSAHRLKSTEVKISSKAQGEGASCYQTEANNACNRIRRTEQTVTPHMRRMLVHTIPDYFNQIPEYRRALRLAQCGAFGNWQLARHAARQDIRHRIDRCHPHVSIGQHRQVGLPPAPAGAVSSSTSV